MTQSDQSNSDELAGSGHLLPPYEDPMKPFLEIERKKLAALERIMAAVEYHSYPAPQREHE